MTTHSGAMIKYWGEICEVLAQAPDRARAEEMVRRIGFDMAQFNAFYWEHNLSMRR